MGSRSASSRSTPRGPGSTRPLPAGDPGRRHGQQAAARDPHYLGVRRPRLRGAEYFDLVDRFVQAVSATSPPACCSGRTSRRTTPGAAREVPRRAAVLQRRHSGDRRRGAHGHSLRGARRGQRLRDQVYVFTAAAGPASACAQIRTHWSGGTHGGRGRARIHVLDSRGLLVEGRARIEDYKLPFTHPRALVPWAPAASAPRLLEVVQQTKATVLLGSPAAGSFDEKIVRGWRNCERPLIFPSRTRPRSRRRARGRLPVERRARARGHRQPVPDVEIGGKRFTIGQGTTPSSSGVGLGAVAVSARAVSDEMFTAARCGSPNWSGERIARRCVFPRSARSRRFHATSRSSSPAPPSRRASRGRARGGRHRGRDRSQDLEAGLPRLVHRPALP